jgi:hypothetical protein
MGAMTTGMKTRVRSTYRLLRPRLSARAKPRPRTLVKTTNPKASSSVLTRDPASSGVLKIALKLSSPTKFHGPTPVQSVNEYHAPAAVVT